MKKWGEIPPYVIEPLNVGLTTSDIINKHSENTSKAIELKEAIITNIVENNHKN